MLRLQGNRLGIASKKAAQAAELCSLAHTRLLQQQEDVITEKKTFSALPQQVRGRQDLCWF